MSHPDPSRRANLVVGQGAICLGFLGLAAQALVTTGGLPAGWGWRISQHAPAWGVASLLLLAVGTWLLWSIRSPQVGWHPTLPGRRFNSLVVYSRPDCPLCEEALELLASYRDWLPTATEVNIEEDDWLRTRFQNHVPVVEIDGRIRFRGRISEMLLRRLIEATPAAPQLRSR